MLLLEIFELNESPLRIAPVIMNKLESPHENKKLFKTIEQNRSKQFVGNYNEHVELWKIVKGRETEIFGLVKEDSYVGYYVRWEQQDASFIDTDWSTQVLVWAGVSPFTKGLPDSVFFDYVLPDTGTVVSDGEQSARGEHFWQRMIATAFKNTKYKIYLVDFNKKSVKRIAKYQDYEKLYHSPDSPWGNKRGYHNGLRIAISDYDFTQE
jgi:hypothetical protein